MDISSAEQQVYDLLASGNSLPVRVRNKLPWTEDEFNELLQSIDVLIQGWSQEHSVPKRIALAFVDIYGAFNFREGFYPQDKLMFLEDMAIALQDKATELFSE